MKTEFQALSAEIIADKITEYGKSGEALRIVCHVNPDGDTVGCAAALFAISAEVGCRPYIVCETGCPLYLRFLIKGILDGGSPIKYVFGDGAQSDISENHVRTVCVDVASPVQMGALRAVIPEVDFMIDHHRSGEAFAPYFTEPDISACGEVLYKVFRIMLDRGMLSQKCTGFAARALYAAISADTGSFKYSNVTPDTHMTAAALLDIIKKTSGMQADSIARRLHDIKTFGALKAAAAAAENTHIFCNGAMAVTLLNREEMRVRGLSDEDTGSIIDVPRSIDGVLVAVSVKEKADGSWKVSSRAAADIDVAAVCASFGGGGHVRAAGCSLAKMSAENALEVVSDAFGKAVETYLKKERPEI